MSGIRGRLARKLFDMGLSSALLGTAVLFYASAFALYLRSFLAPLQETAPRLALVFLRAGFLVSTFYLGQEAVEQGFFLPVVNFSQAMAFFAWSLAFVYLVLLVKNQSESFGLIVAPVLLLLAGAAWGGKLAGAVTAAPRPVLMHPYFGLHIASAFFAYASFTLSFAAGLLYLIQHHELKSKHPGAFYHKLPSLENLERLIYQPILWGAPLLGLAIVIGLLWSKSAFGEFSILDPKTIATAITAFAYTLILGLRSASVLRGRQVAVLSLIAFLLIVSSFVGTRFIPGSHHYMQ